MSLHQFEEELLGHVDIEVVDEDLLRQDRLDDVAGLRAVVLVHVEVPNLVDEVRRSVVHVEDPHQDRG